MNMHHVSSREEVAQHAKDRFGFEFPKMKDGQAIGTLKVKEEHLNTLSTPYGGHLFHLADITCGLANLSGGNAGPTVSGNINFINGAKAGDTLICTAKTDKHGKTISYVSCEIRTEQGTLVATASFSFFNVEIPF